MAKRKNISTHSTIDSKVVEEVIKKVLRETEKQKINDIAEAVVDKIAAKNAEQLKEKVNEKWYKRPQIFPISFFLGTLILAILVLGVFIRSYYPVQDQLTIYTYISSILLSLLYSILIWIFQDRQKYNELKKDYFCVTNALEKIKGDRDSFS